MPLPTAWWLCCPNPTDSQTDPATVGYAVARAGIRNAKMGIVTPAQATYNAETGHWVENFPVWNWRPDRVIVRYYAGYPLDSDGQVARKIRSIITDLTVASMPERICACDIANKALHYLQWDLSRVGNNVEMYATNNRILDNIFGTKRGQVSAWRKLKHMVLHFPMQT